MASKLIPELLQIVRISFIPAKTLRHAMWLIFTWIVIANIPAILPDSLCPFTPKFTCFDPNLQDSLIGGDSVMGEELSWRKLVPLWRVPEENPHPDYHMRTRLSQSHLWTRKWLLISHGRVSVSNWAVNYAAFKGMRNTFLLFSHPVIGVLWELLEQKATLPQKVQAMLLQLVKFPFALSVCC